MAAGRITKYLTVLAVMMALLLSCTGMVFTKVSSPSLTEPSNTDNNKVERFEDIVHSVTVSEIEIYPFVLTSKIIHDYNTSLIIPFDIGQRESMTYGKPFGIDLALRAKDNGASFSPLSTELLFAGKTELIYPAEVITSENPGILGPPHFLRPCTYGRMPPGSKILSAGTVTIPSKYSVGSSGNIVNDRWLCVQLQFDIPTPDPSERFQLQLGEIITPEGKHVHPTIYFSPKIYKEFQH